MRWDSAAVSFTVLGEAFRGSVFCLSSSFWQVMVWLSEGEQLLPNHWKLWGWRIWLHSYKTWKLHSSLPLCPACFQTWPELILDFPRQNDVKWCKTMKQSCKNDVKNVFPGAFGNVKVFNGLGLFASFLATGKTREVLFQQTDYCCASCFQFILGRCTLGIIMSCCLLILLVVARSKQIVWKSILASPKCSRLICWGVAFPVYKTGWRHFQLKNWRIFGEGCLILSSMGNNQLLS